LSNCFVSSKWHLKTNLLLLADVIQPFHLDYFGIMQAVMKKFAWVFHTLMGVSGVEAVLAVSSPFVGQVGRSNIDHYPFCDPVF
jgi:nucleoside permease NupC